MTDELGGGDSGGFSEAQKPNDVAHSSEQKPKEVGCGGDQKHLKILVVDDEESILKIVLRILEHSSYDKGSIFVFGERDKALKSMKTQKIDVIISDYVMPGMQYSEFREKALLLSPDARILLMSGAIGQAEDKGAIADDFVCKPFDLIQFKAALDNVISKKK